LPPVCETLVVPAGTFKGAEELDEYAGLVDKSVDFVVDVAVDVVDLEDSTALATAADELEPFFVPPNTPTPQRTPKTKIVKPRRPSKGQNQLGHLS
jgi:hypothetical protein